ncbi:MAG: hypothetical protein ACKPKO_54005 [Candidatus Fonsibacter sp.]
MVQRKKNGNPCIGDALLRRASICIPNSIFNQFGPKYVVAASLDQSPQGVRFRLPKGYKDKETIGLNNPWRNQGKWKTGRSVELDDQYICSILPRLYEC